MTAPELASLLQGCKDAPDDDSPRLVLADWLDDHDQPDRAEFVRLSLRLGAGEVHKGDEAPALARLHDLFSRHAADWLGLGEWAGQVHFRRGLLYARAGLEQADELPGAVAADALPWLEDLDFFCGQQKWVGDLLDNDAARHFSGLELTRVRLAAPTLGRLAKSRQAPRLRSLRVALSKVGPQKPVGDALALGDFAGLRSLAFADWATDGAVAALASAGWLAGLTSFAATGCGKGVAALARSPHAPRPARLSLAHVDPGKDGMRALAASPLLSRVADLSLFAVVGEAQAAAFAACDWPRLRSLSLRAGKLNDAGLRALADGRFGSLRRLHLDRCGLTPAGLRSLLASPWLAGLRSLTLDGTLDDAVVAELAGCDALAGLEHLELSGGGFGTPGVAALLNSRQLAALRTLNLDAHARLAPSAFRAEGLPSLTALSLAAERLAAEAVRALAASPLAPRLRHLDLSGCGVDGGGVAALCVSAFSGLTSLDLSHDPLGPAGAVALARGPWRGLLRLGLARCGLQDAGLSALLRSEAFGSLVVLSLESNDDSRQGHRALLDWPGLPKLAMLTSSSFGGEDAALSRLRYPVAFRGY